VGWLTVHTDLKLGSPYRTVNLTSSDNLRALGSTLIHSIGGTVVLLVILALNVYKPRGMTRYGWRKQQEEQRRKQHVGEPDLGNTG
jgi:hypothetical protein